MKAPRQVLCPTCQTLTAWSDNPWRPFCSHHCQLVDLAHWLHEDYRFSDALPQEDWAAEPREDSEHNPD